MSKKRYRIRKAGPGETPGIQNRTAQFLKKAQMGMEQQAMQQQPMPKQTLTKEVEELVNYIQTESQKESSPIDIIGSLIENNIDTDLIEKAFVVLGASSQEIRPIISQIAQMKMQEINANRPPVENQDMPQPMESSEEVQEQPAQPQMSKGGYKKKLLKKAKEGRQLETETPGSILPQPATLNNFIEGVKNEGNKFYADQMADMAYNTPQPNMFQGGGEAGYIDDKGRFVYYDEESGPKARRQERKDARQARREARRQGDDNINYRDIYKDLGTMGADFASSLMPQIFSHRNTDFEDFSRKGTGLENSDVDVYFKKKPFGRREWSIKGLDYTSIPGYGSNIGFPGTGLGGYSTYTTRRTIPGVTVGSEMREIVNKLNDDTNKAITDREKEISAADVKPLDNYIDPRNLSQEQVAADLEGKRLDAGMIPDYEDSNLVNPFANATMLFSPDYEQIATPEQQYERKMAEKELQGMRNTGMSDEELDAKEAEGMSRKNQLLRYLDQQQRAGKESVNLSSNFTEPGEGEMEANEQVVKDYEARQAELARQAAMPWNKYVKSYKDYIKNVDEATKDEYGYTDEYREWNRINTAENFAEEVPAYEEDPAYFERNDTAAAIHLKNYPNSTYDDYIKDTKETLQEILEYDGSLFTNFDSTGWLDYEMRDVMMWENASEEDKNRIRKNWEKAKTYTKDQARYKKQDKKREQEEELKKKGSKEAAIRYFAKQERMSDSDFRLKYDVIPNSNTKGGWYLVQKGDNRSIGTPYSMGKYVEFNPYNKKDGGAIELLEGPFGGAVTPELYEYVYGGMEDNPTFAPGGMFKKPKVDPALGFKSPTAEVEEYRKTVYPTSKGIFGQMKDALKEGTGYNALTQGQGMKGLFNALGQAIAPTDFTWLSKKGDPKSAYGYIGATNEQTGQPLANTIVREYGTRLGDNQDIIGSSTDLQYKDRLFRKPKLTVTDSPVDSATGDYTGFRDYFTGQSQGFLNQNKEDGQNAYGGLNKFVMAGEIDSNMFEDQNAPNLVDQTKENEFNLADCTEEELLDPTSMCYKKSITQNEYNVNKARTIQTPFIAQGAQYLGDKIVDFATMKQNLDKEIASAKTADQVANIVSTDVSQGYDPVTGYKSMVDSQFNEPVAISSARPRTFNQFAKSGGQYAIGGVYDLTPEEIDAIMKAGGEIEFL